jgi:thiosulfate reductase cytochrome b subunit
MRTTHPYLARLSHWLFAISTVVMGASGLQIFQAFPSFSAKLPEPFALPVPAGLGLGGWLGGALAWHFSFAWPFGLAVMLYAVDLARGGWRRLWLAGDDWRGIWPMARYYFLRGPKPPEPVLYNPLQKSAYLTATAALFVLLLTGLMLAQPVQLAALVSLMGGWQAVRMVHFGCLAVLVGFLPGHLVMVALAGWPAMRAMVTGRSAMAQPADQERARAAS